MLPMLLESSLRYLQRLFLNVFNVHQRINSKPIVSPIETKTTPQTSPRREVQVIVLKITKQEDF